MVTSDILQACATCLLETLILQRDITRKILPAAIDGGVFSSTISNLVVA